MYGRIVLALVLAAFTVTAAPAMAAKGGNGKGNGNDLAAAGSCVVDGDVVNASGLPEWELLNLMVTDASGTTGWVLGYTDSGSLSVRVPLRFGTTTYEFVSRTWGPSGSKYTVYASCSA